MATPNPHRSDLAAGAAPPLHHQVGWLARLPAPGSLGLTVQALTKARMAALGLAARQAIVAGLQQATQDDRVKAVVLIGAGAALT